MAYRFKFGESANKGFRRLAREQVELALRELAADPVLPLGIHGTRKVLKRLRALLMCAAPAIDAKTFRKRIAALRDLSQLLAPQRDAVISVQTVQNLEVHFGKDRAAVFSGLRAHLDSTAAKMAGSLDPQLAEQVQRQLVVEGKKLAAIRLKGKGFEPIAKGIETSYRKGRRAFENAYQKPSDKKFHDLRKAVQSHWRHMNLISNAWPGVFEARVSEARDLSDILGDDHDIFVMQKHASSLSGAEQAEISRLCTVRQTELRNAVQFRAARLFAEPPKAFKRRISEYWRCGTKISAQQRTQSVAVEPVKVASTPTAARSIGSAPRLATKTPGRGQSQSSR